MGIAQAAIYSIANYPGCSRPGSQGGLTPAVRARLAGQGLFPSGSMPDEFAAQIKKEIEKMQRIARFAKISLD